MAQSAPSHLLDRSPLHLLHRAVQVTDALLQRQIEATGLTPRQFLLLTAVANSQGSSQTDLVEATGMDRSTLADVIRRLETKRLVMRERRKTDARAYEVSLTVAGRKALSMAQPQVGKVENDVLALLPANRTQLFCDDLRRIVDQLTAEMAAGQGPSNRDAATR